MTVLLVDDERQVIDGILHGIDFPALGFNEILTARSGEEAQNLIRSQKVDVLVTDIEMADLSGLGLLEWIRDSGYPIITIYCTAFRSFDYAKKAIELHAYDYFLKPVKYTELTEKLERAVRSLGGKRSYAESAANKDDILFPTSGVSHGKKVRAAVKTVCDYIDGHLTEELTRTKLSKLVFMNADYLGTLFKEEMNCSITMYIQQKRLDRAKALLRETDYPISRIAELVGYDNISYFSKLFRQKIGCQPGEYRKRGE